MSIINKCNIEIVEHQKTVKDDVPKRKINTRGVLKVDGFNEFNPELNVKITK